MSENDLVQILFEELGYQGLLAYDCNLRVITQAPSYTAPMETGQESSAKVGKIDIRFFDAWERDYIHIYFAWECKLVGDRQQLDEKHKRLAAEYITSGMLRFIDAKYSEQIATAGMLGYVLAGQPPTLWHKLTPV